jgi:hypothetical protein
MIRAYLVVHHLPQDVIAGPAAVGLQVSPSPLVVVEEGVAEATVHL